MATEAQKRAVKKYNEKLSMVRFRVQPEDLEAYKKHAKEQGESLATFLKRAAAETMTRDKEK